MSHSSILLIHRDSRLRSFLLKLTTKETARKEINRDRYLPQINGFNQQKESEDGAIEDDSPLSDDHSDSSQTHESKRTPVKLDFEIKKEENSPPNATHPELEISLNFDILNADFEKVIDKNGSPRDI